MTIKAGFIIIMGAMFCFYEGKIPQEFRLKRIGRLPFAKDPIIIEQPIIDQTLAANQGKSYFHIGVVTNKEKED